MKLFSPGRWSIAWRLRLGMLIVPLLLLALAAYQYYNSRIVSERYSDVLYHATLLLTSQNMMHGIENMQAAKAAFIADPAPQVWRQYETARADVDSNYHDSLLRVTTTSGIDKKLQAFYAAHLQWRTQVAEPAMQAARAGRMATARAIDGRGSLVPQHNTFNNLRRTSVDVRTRQIHKADQLRHWSSVSLFIVEGLALILTLVLVTSLVHMVTQPMNDLVEQSRRIEAGDYSPNLLRQRDEYGRVVRAMNEMAEAVRMREAELRITRDALTRSGDELQKKNQELEEFVYSVSHDLKAPIISMQGYLAALQTDHAASLNDEARFFIERAVANSEHLQNLIADLIDLSRIGRISEVHETFDSCRLMQQIVSELTPQAVARGVTIEIASNLPLVCGDRKQLYQVFVNLIDNAIKYSDPAQPQRWVRIECTQSAEEWCFVVRDNGIGIAPRHRAKVFNIFQRVDNTNTPGTGIGLSIVQRAAATHGGRTWVESSGVGAGSAFYFTLPRVDATTADQEQVAVLEGQTGVLQTTVSGEEKDGGTVGNGTRSSETGAVYSTNGGAA